MTLSEALRLGDFSAYRDAFIEMRKSAGDKATDWQLARHLFEAVRTKNRLLVGIMSTYGFSPDEVVDAACSSCDGDTSSPELPVLPGILEGSE